MISVQETNTDGGGKVERRKKNRNESGSDSEDRTRRQSLGCGGGIFLLLQQRFECIVSWIAGRNLQLQATPFGSPLLSQSGRRQRPPWEDDGVRRAVEVGPPSPDPYTWIWHAKFGGLFRYPKSSCSFSCSFLFVYLFTSIVFFFFNPTIILFFN